MYITFDKLFQYVLYVQHQYPNKFYLFIIVLFSLADFKILYLVETIRIVVMLKHDVTCQRHYVH